MPLGPKNPGFPSAFEPLRYRAKREDFRARYNGLELPQLVVPVGGNRSEWSQLLREARCYGGAANAAAVAAQLAGASLTNPAGSGVTLLVKRITASIPGAAGAIACACLGAPQAAFDTPGGGITTQGLTPDAVAGVPSAVATGLFGSMASTLSYGTQSMVRRVPADTTADFSNPDGFLFELPEGSCVSVFNKTVNVALQFDFEWAEVPSTLYV